MTEQTELFPELGPQQLQPTGRLVFELVPDTSRNGCTGCAFESIEDCAFTARACTANTMYRLVEDSTC